MPFPLHKAAAGLLEHFRLRTLGAQPPMFGDTVVPVADVRQFYGADLKAVTTGVSNNGALLPELTAQEAVALAGVAAVHAVAGIFIVGAAPATNVSISVGIRSGSTIHVNNWFFPALAATQIVRFGTILPPWVLKSQIITGQVFAEATVSGTAAGVDHTIAVNQLIDALAGAG